MLSTVYLEASSSDLVFQNEEDQVSYYTKISRVISLIKEVIFKEYYSVYVNTFSFFEYLINPNKYNLNPQNLTANNTTAKVVILIHGQGGGPFCFFPMAKEFEKKGIQNVFTLKLKPTASDMVPIAQLDEKIRQIKEQCLSQGINSVDIALIGHSLGAIVAFKKVWGRARTGNDISVIVSIAGRLRYVKNPYYWFCQDVRPEIEISYSQYKEDPNRALLYTIRGDGDGIVPKESSHIQRSKENQWTVPGYGHGGVLISPEAIACTASIVRDWSSRKQVISA